MKIVVTGSESFVGKELIRQCNEKNIDVIGIDSVKIQKSDYEFFQLDIRSIEIEKFIPDNVEVIVHLAALSKDSSCRGKAYECFDVNVMGTLNLMRIAKKKHAKQFIFASSEWVYDNFINNEEKDENSFIDISNHTSEYALSKLVSEMNLKQEFLQNFCSTTILRFGIIYGPREDNWSAVEAIFDMGKNKDKVTIGSLKTGRRFVHVSDIANGIIQSFGLKGFNIINLTGEKIETLEDIIKASEKILGKTLKIVETDPDNISIRNPSNKKAEDIISWKPKINLLQGLESLKGC